MHAYLHAKCDTIFPHGAKSKVYQRGGGRRENRENCKVRMFEVGLESHTKNKTKTSFAVRKEKK